MSFSGSVKEELGRLTPAAKHCRFAELAAILHFCGRLEIEDTEEDTGIFFVENGQKKLKYVRKIAIQSENDVISEKIFTLLRKTFNIISDMCRCDSGRGNISDIVLEDQEIIRHLLQNTGYLSSDGQLKLLEEAVPAEIIHRACCRRSFLRAVFICIGSMSDPEKNNHLELVCTTLGQAQQIRDMLRGFDVEARITRRKKYVVVYVKDGAGISDFLNIVEAHMALMDYENCRIRKEIANSVNRRVNCEAANINKTVSASGRQIEDIYLLRDRYGLENLPENLRQMALVRLEHEDAPLSELGGYLDPPVGKSGVNHRLRKLSELADKYRD